MKSIKYFEYKNTYEFERFLNAYDYRVENITGFKFGWKEQYHGNILKAYMVYFDDGEYELFRIVYFKSFNEYHQSRLGFNGNKLLQWYDDANVRKYKVKDVWDMKDEYVIVS